MLRTGLLSGIDQSSISDQLIRSLQAGDNGVLSGVGSNQSHYRHREVLIDLRRFGTTKNGSTLNTDQRTIVLN